MTSALREISSERVIYLKATWLEIAFHLVKIPFVLTRSALTIGWLILGEPFRQYFREPEATQPRMLIDEAFSVLADRMKVHGFVREGRKRQLKRTRGDATDRIGYSARKYNESGLSAEFSIWLSTTATELPVRLAWSDGEVAFEDPITGEVSIEVDLGKLKSIGFPIIINLYPRHRRAARIIHAANLVERLALPWFLSK